MHTPSHLSLVIRYSVFAIIATLSNVASQILALMFYRGSHELWLAIPVGTAVGLIVKYLLDRRYIFHAHGVPLDRDLRRFVAYTGTGVFTTGLFWGSEIAFDAVFASDQARYLGAVIGLALGYFLKYQLDRRYVFAQAPDA